jgi:hypothetical protein
MFSNRIIPTGVALMSVAFAALATGCATQSGDGGDGGIQPPFIPTAENFSCFRNWSSTAGVGPDGAPDPSGVTDGGIHAGPMTTYINAKPPHGSTSFPIGTIIVKEQKVPPLTQRQIFAMAKRGPDQGMPFSPNGAVNWEFYELQNIDSCNVSIVWSRIPINSDPYASNPEICDECHVLAKSNDYVWTAGLNLSSL